MRKKGHKKGHNYKFTEKRHSVKGVSAFAMAFFSIALGIAVMVLSFQNRGRENVYLGGVGILSMMVAVFSLLPAISGLREENSYKLFPILGMVFGLFAAGGWVSVYLVGIFW
ncbi:DUF6142 family protein [Lachnospiraceae bacterium ZAX-1]